MNTYSSKAGKELPTVLAVDDFYLNLRLIKEALTGVVNLYTVRSACDAIKVIELVKKVDLLLLDLEMPDMNGFEFLERLRLMPEYADTPVIIVSSNSKLKTLEKIVEYSIVDYVVKPFNPDMLREKVIGAINDINRS